MSPRTILFIGVLQALVLCFLPGGTSGQSRAFVLCEGAQDMVSGEILESPRLGVIEWEGAEATFELLHVFAGHAFAADVILSEGGDVLYVAAEDTVYRMDAYSGEVLAVQALQGARRLLLAGDRVFVTRGDYDPLTWNAVPFDHYLVALDAVDLSWQGDWIADGTYGPAWSTEGLCLSGGMVHVGINNAFAYGEEVGLIGRVDLLTGAYEEVDLGPDGLNPVHLFDAGNGAVVSVNARQYEGTSLSRWDAGTGVLTEVVAEVTAGCGAAAWHEDGVLYQVYGEGDFRKADGTSLAPQQGWMGNGSAVYSMAPVPGVGALLGTTDFVQEGHVELLDWEGQQVWTLPVGVAPGRIVMQSTPASIAGITAERHPVSGTDLLGRPRSLEAPGLTIIRWSDGTASKVFRTAD